MHNKIICSICYNILSNVSLGVGVECENCGNVIEGITFLDSESASPEDSIFISSSYSTIYKTVQSPNGYIDHNNFHDTENQLNSNERCTNDSENTSITLFNHSDKKTEELNFSSHAKYKETSNFGFECKLPQKSISKIRNTYSNTNAFQFSSQNFRSFWNNSFKSYKRRKEESFLNIDRIYNQIEIGNHSLVLEMIQRIFNVLNREIKNISKLEQLVGACCFIQGRLKGLPITIKDIMSKLEYTKNLHKFTQYIKRICYLLNIHNLPILDPMDLFDRALNNIIDSNNTQLTTYVNIYPSSLRNSDIYQTNSSLLKDLDSDESMNSLLDLFNFDSKSHSKKKYKNEFNSFISKESVHKHVISQIKSYIKPLNRIFNLIIKIFDNNLDKNITNLNKLKISNINNGICEASYYAAILSITLWALDISLPIKFLIRELNTSRTSFYRKRHSLLITISHYFNLQNQFLNYSNLSTLDSIKYELLRESGIYQHANSVNWDSFQYINSSNEPYTLENSSSTFFDYKISDNCNNQEQNSIFCLEQLSNINYNKISTNSDLQAAHIYGIHNDSKSKRWILRWKDSKGKRHNKCFSQKVHGYEKSYSKAKLFLQNLIKTPN